MSWGQVLTAAGYWDGGDLLRVPTSGTTGGAPRTVLRTVRSWTDSFEPFTDCTGIDADDVVLASGPASSMFVFARAHAAALGARVIAGPRWRPDDAREATVAHLTTTMLADVLEVDRPRLRLAVVAGAALAPALRDRARAEGIDVVEYYGAAELSFVGIGRERLEPFPGAEVAVGGDLIWVRSPWTALGYADGATGPLRTDGAWCSVGTAVRWSTGSSPSTAATTSSRPGHVGAGRRRRDGRGPLPGSGTSPSSAFRTSGRRGAHRGRRRR